jgi:hypothetical protein
MEQEVQDVPYSKPVPLWIGSQACRRHRCHGREHSWVQDACTASGSHTMHSGTCLPAT